MKKKIDFLKLYMFLWPGRNWHQLLDELVRDIIQGQNESRRKRDANKATKYFKRTQ